MKFNSTTFLARTVVCSALSISYHCNVTLPVTASCIVKDIYVNSILRCRLLILILVMLASRYTDEHCTE